MILDRLKIEPRYWLMAASGWVAVALTALPEGSVIRVAAVYLFVLLVPGFVLSALVAADLAERWVLTIAISAALGIVVSVAMTAIRNDSWLLRISILATVTTVGAIAVGVRAGRPGTETSTRPAEWTAQKVNQP